MIKSRVPIFVLFQIVNCPFCREFKPIFEKHAQRGRGVFAEVILDDYDNPLWDECNIKYVPTVILYKEGKEVSRKDARRMVGLSEEDLKDILSKAA